MQLPGKGYQREGRLETHVVAVLSNEWKVGSLPTKGGGGKPTANGEPELWSTLVEKQEMRMSNK